MTEGWLGSRKGMQRGRVLDGWTAGLVGKMNSVWLGINGSIVGGRERNAWWLGFDDWMAEWSGKESGGGGGYGTVDEWMVGKRMQGGL